MERALHGPACLPSECSDCSELGGRRRAAGLFWGDLTVFWAGRGRAGGTASRAEKCRRAGSSSLLVLGVRCSAVSVLSHPPPTVCECSLPPPKGLTKPAHSPVSRLFHPSKCANTFLHPTPSICTLLRVVAAIRCPVWRVTVQLRLERARWSTSCCCSSSWSSPFTEQPANKRRPELQQPHTSHSPAFKSNPVSRH